VNYQGQPVAGLERATAVAAIGGATPALFVRTEDQSMSSACFLVTVRSGALVKETAPVCGNPSDAMPITNDVAAFAASRTRADVPGWVDHETLATPGLYLIQGTLLDTRNLTLRAVDLVGPSRESRNSNVPPLGISPDIAWWVAAGRAMVTARRARGVIRLRRDRSAQIRRSDQRIALSRRRKPLVVLVGVRSSACAAVYRLSPQGAPQSLC
jgi:hypothetical protein